MLPPFAVVLPAAGSSSRFGGKEKKPFVSLDGRAIWLRAAELFVARKEVQQCLVVIAPEDRDLFDRRYGANLMFLNIQAVDGGAERFESVANALAKLEPDVEFVAIHDAVRPCATSGLIDAVFMAAARHGAAIPAVQVADTVKQVDDQMNVRATVPREGLWLAQTPQVFRRDWLLDAYARRAELGKAITDDAQLVEAAGHPVHVVPGLATNFKITTPADLALAELVVRAQQAAKPVNSGRPFEDEAQW